MNPPKGSLLLYAVTDRHWLNGRPLEQAVEETLRGGATMVQLREKDLPRDEFRAEALRVKEVCRRFGVPLLINDNVELAREVGADGVHVGQDDMDMKAARALLGPHAIIGVSAHNVEEAVRAERDGADYLGSGAVFPTGTKGNVRALPLDELKAICAAVKIPVVAIGGIGAENIGRLAGSGVVGAAVVSAIFAQSDIEAAARGLRELAEKAFC